MRESVEKAVRTLSLAAAMIVVSEIILGAIFYFSGAVTGGKAGDVAKVLQGRLTSPPEEPQGAAKPPLEVKSQEELQAAVAQWEKSRKQQEEALAAERDAVSSMKNELEKVRAEIDDKDKALRQQLAEFEDRKSAEEAAAADQGFKEAVATYSAMEAKAVADSLYRLDDPAVVRYLKAFKTAFRAEVLGEMKKIEAASESPPSPGESDRVGRLLEIISGASTGGASGAVASASK